MLMTDLENFLGFSSPEDKMRALGWSGKLGVLKKILKVLDI